MEPQRDRGRSRNPNESTYLFLQGGRCALLGAAVDRVADFDSHFEGECISLEQLGLRSEIVLTPVRLLLLRDTPRSVGLVVRGPIEAQAVAAEDIIPLPPAFFGHSAFSALVRFQARQYSLLLAVRSLALREVS